MVVSKNNRKLHYTYVVDVMFQSFEVSHVTNISVSSRKNIMHDSLMIGAFLNLNSPEVSREK